MSLIVVLSSLALPGTNGFIGEFLILLGTFQARPAAAVLATLGVVVAVAYLLGFVGRVFHGPVREDLRGMPDLRAREALVFVPIIAVILWVGFFPQPFLDRSAATVNALLSRVTASARPDARGRAGGPARGTGGPVDALGRSRAHRARARARRDRVRGPAVPTRGDRARA